MADVKIEELLDDVVVHLPSAVQVRARGGRRRARRQAAGAVVAATAVMAGALVWAGVDGDEGRARPSTGPSTPAIVVDGMPRILPPDEVPGNGRWHWQAQEEDTKDSPLPRIAESGSCPDSFRERKTPEHVQYSATYYSEGADGAASASHRIVSYASPEVAGRERAAYEAELEACGLRYRGGERPRWSGPAVGDGTLLRVTVQQDGKWLSVVEVRVESS
ncbi:hypothetical protein [Streptomyces spectabilis]|uniref:Uncharacterized protein n=1 Tax=Streptomyces spectabilis TaxID=68270 RepID=A0A5P2XMY2_STRST|nr:hypothetical protein [Streptomyces spectabilis]MBB5102607.1 hypothetical protein [Streptomyces spectabilis]MCI3907646.1 hypothetical protein [Streptomyces spectabilis]QEV64330.1 hypothetical protein CP982_41230 [Streptomyces spectabilis]GGV30848.1 hypothetical protein GCM10010245_49920 [Streptomyces spectabilis]